MSDQVASIRQLASIRQVASILALTASLATGNAVVAMAQGDGEVVAETVPLTVGLGYIPSVQFAPFYLADEAGYYADAGLDVTFQNENDPELITLVARGALDIGMGDGTSVVAAVSQGIPVRYGATIYGRDPNVVFSLGTSGIETAADLAGARIGIPGRHGSSWVALQALLASAGLTADDTEIVVYPYYGQAVALEAGQVDAATGFFNNEPVQLTLRGQEVNVLRVSDVAPLPGPGLVVGDDTIAAKGEALRAFTGATIRAMEEISADPQVGLDAAFVRVPELAGDPETQLAILEATIDSWMSDYAAEHGLGSLDRSGWESGLQTMRSLPGSTISDEVTLDDLLTDALSS